MAFWLRLNTYITNEDENAPDYALLGIPSPEDGEIKPQWFNVAKAVTFYPTVNYSATNIDFDGEVTVTVDHTEEEILSAIMSPLSIVDLTNTTLWPSTLQK